MMRFFNSMPLTVKLPALAAALMITVGVVASYQVFSGLTRVQDERLQEIGRLHIDGLSIALGPAVVRRDAWEVFDVLERAQNFAKGQRLGLTIVTDAAGVVIAASDPIAAPIDTKLDVAAGRFQTIDRVTMNSDSLIPANNVTIVAPLVDQGRVVGQIVSELDVSDLAAERRQTLLVLISANSALTLLLALTGYMALRRMLRPVTLLTNHIANHANLPEPIPDALIPANDRELARLFQTYNQMTEATEAKSEMARRLAERERFVGLGRLASSLAHEINNPLGGLLNAADTIQTYADRPDVVRTSAGLIIRGIKHLRDVSHAILEQHRIDPFAERLTLEDIDDLRLLVEPEIKRQGQTLHWQVAQFSNGADVSAGPVRQIALNLLLNASAAASGGGNVGFIAEFKDDALLLIITDDGSGLSGTAWARLMTDDPLQPGGGVGLRMVRELTLGLGGAVNLVRVNNQTEVSVHIPVKMDAVS